MTIDPLAILEQRQRNAGVQSGAPRVEGKFLLTGSEKLYVKGVTYGTFQPDAEGTQYPAAARIDEDFRMMAAHGINAIRVYTPPPERLLDLAGENGLRVMVGLPWEQHISFLDDRKRPRQIRETVREAVRNCSRHPAVLCYAIGNEIPASIVRWHGARRVERFLESLYDCGKQEHPEALFTYVNFPTTEYLNLPFVDLAALNVYLETPEKLRAYLARAQTLAGAKPLLMAEVGFDSRRKGVEMQAKTLSWQVREVFAAGCSGVFLFAWTDEWYRGGAEIDDWDFGLVTRNRRPKPALEVVHEEFDAAPRGVGVRLPRMSVVVCSYNGSRTIRETLTRLQDLDYPDWETIVVDDGSTDDTAAIAREFPIRLISVNNGGLSNARNVGAGNATGEIVVYLDDDAYPDRDWLNYLGHAFATTDHAAIGGPNLSPPQDPLVAQCIAASPGNATHVLLTDTVAEHIPGCAFAVRKRCLDEIGGWDPRFHVAGDDVDLCWRLEQRGWTIGFHHSAVVWHHRRNRLSAYWRQQRGYGRAEALLEKKWPGKYSGSGHTKWAGRIYNPGLLEWVLWRRGRIFQGTWGTAPFQSVYEPAPLGLFTAASMPEWYALTLLLATLSVAGLVWRPLLAVVPLLVFTAMGILCQAAAGGMRAGGRWRRRLLVAFLHATQPVARLWGRLEYGLVPWGPGPLKVMGPRGVVTSVWSENWRDSWQWLSRVHDELEARNSQSGGDYDAWDLEVAGGMMGTARLRMVIEEHGMGKQMLRFRVWPRWQWGGLVATAALAGAGAAAGIGGSMVVAFLLCGLGGAVGAWCLHDAFAAAGALLEAIERLRKQV